MQTTTLALALVAGSLVGASVPQTEQRTPKHFPPITRVIDRARIARSTAQNRAIVRALTDARRTGDWMKPERLLRRMLASGDGFALEQIELAKLLLRKGSKVEARRLLGQALHSPAVGTFRTPLLAQYAKLSLEQGDRAEFQWALGELGQSNPLGAYLDGGRTLLGWGDYEAAIPMFQSALWIDPKNEIARKGLAAARSGLLKKEAKARTKV